LVFVASPLSMQQ